MVKKTKSRVYLNDTEKKVLVGLLDEWNSKPDKRTRDAFVSAEALPKIQQLDLSKFGPDVIAKDKAAKILWDSRVQAVYTWFKNNKPYKDRTVFKLERKIPLRRVVGKLKADELHEIIKSSNPDMEKGDKDYPGHFQKALTSLIKDLTTEELEELEATRVEWQNNGPPIDVRLKAASKYSRKGIINAHQLLHKEMYVSCVTFSFYPEPGTGVVAVVCHDYIADLHSKSHGKKIKTFKEWNSQGYSRIVQEMIGYANYVDKQRKEDMEADITDISEPVNFDNGPGGLPLLPGEVKGVRGSETTKHAQEIIRAYFLRHYQLATGSENARTPWAVIGEEPSKFFDPACLPIGFKFQDPSRMGIIVKALLNHLRERQAEHGVNAFSFQHVLRGSTLEPSQYPDETKRILEKRATATETENMDIPPSTPKPTPRKSPKKKSKETDHATVDPKPLSNVMEVKQLPPLITSGPEVSDKTPPRPAPAFPMNSMPFPPGLPPGVPPNAFHPSFPPYGFPYNISYFLQQPGMDNFKPPGEDGYHPWSGPPPFPQPNIDPRLLPQGEPTFHYPLPYSQMDSIQNPQVTNGAAVSNQDSKHSEIKTPSSKNKRTPKRKRSASPSLVEYTPSRSGRIRKQTKR